MKRSAFIRNAGLLTAGVVINKTVLAAFDERVSLRPPTAKRNFTSSAVEDAIKQFKAKVANKELAWMFENCFPNTLDTTVFYAVSNGKPDTYVITGDIDAMWLRDSSAQVWPYLTFIKKDKKLQQMVAGVINRQMQCIHKDPYANAFYKDENKVSEWKTDHTDMKPGVHERKWEIDSLCYPLRLSYHYWKNTGDTSPFDEHWKQGVSTILATFKEQQRKTGRGSYHFQRDTNKPTDTLPMDGYGFPVKPNGLICSMFRPSDDATIYPYLIPSNFFAVVSLKQTAEILQTLNEKSLATELLTLATEVEQAIQKHGIVNHPYAGKIYAFEVDGLGNANMMDDANIPSLMALPYLDALPASDPIYQNTRKFALSAYNPYFYKSNIAEGIGGPHVGKDGMIWPLPAAGLPGPTPFLVSSCGKPIS
jgi:meiotically up-regulated gene 157 (Mug157) protein